MKDMLDTTFLYEFIERHYLLDRQAAAKLLIEGILPLEVVVRLRHLKQALGADELLAFDEAIVAPTAVPGIKQRNEILENSVGG